MSDQAPGWYHAEGDPVGTVRYWDGGRWVGEPTSPEARKASDFGPPGRTPASTGKRLGGRALDFLIGAAILGVLIGPLYVDMFQQISDLGANPTNDEITAVAESVFDGQMWRGVLAGVVTWLWEALFYAFVGATPGKLVAGTRLASAASGDSPVGVGQALLRTLNKGLGILAGFAALSNLLGLAVILIAVVSLILLFTDDQSRTIMDRIAGTVVVNK